jgi:hypothetical protein
VRKSTGSLKYEMLPSKTFTCLNAAGNDKLKLTFIGKFKSCGLVGPKSVPI